MQCVLACSKSLRWPYDMGLCTSLGFSLRTRALKNYRRPTYDIWRHTPQEKDKGAMGDGKEFQDNLATIFSRIVHWIFLAIWLLLFRQRRMQLKPIKRRLFC